MGWLWARYGQMIWLLDVSKNWAGIELLAAPLKITILKIQKG